MSNITKDPKKKRGAPQPQNSATALSSAPSLASRHADLTKNVILNGAIELLEQAPVSELSVRAISRQTNVSERTIFRYFATREAMIDAVALAVANRLGLPPDPTTLEELLAYPAILYERFEATSTLTKAALHSEIYHRIRTADTKHRGQAIQTLVDRLAPQRSETERRRATANIRYHLIATTWHYYRFYFGLSLEDCIGCARMAIVQALHGLGVEHLYASSSE